MKSERIGKICPETGEIIPCRPKRKAEPVNNLSADIAPEATATRTNTGGTDLLEWAGRTSGLDAKVRAAFSGSEDPFGCPLLGDDLGLDETGMQRLFQALANDVEDLSLIHI